MKKNIIGIIGGGNMGEALIKGLAKKKLFSILVGETFSKRAQDLKKKYKVEIVETETANVIANAQVIIFAVKPQDMQAAFSWIRSDDLRKDKLFISIAAGLTTKYFENNIKNIVLHEKPRVIRAMPNMPALINEGITGICRGKYATATDLKKAQGILSAIGETVIVEESMMDAVTAVSGSGPAYVFYFVEQWVKAARTLGFNKTQAKLLVYKTLLGSAHLLENSKFDVATLRAKVTSRGGTTAAAMDVFVKRAFAQLMEDALLAAETRAKQLAK